MGRSNRQAYQISLIDLIKAAHSDERAMRAWKRYQELRASGVAHPSVTYSQFEGYQVDDPNAIYLRSRQTTTAT